MIVLLCGKSGCGKDTILRRLIKDKNIVTYNGSYKFEPVVSYTTRPPREKEIQDVDYHFVDKAEFMRRVGCVGEGSIIEFRSYDTTVNGIPDTWYYGSPYLQTNGNKHYVAVLDIDGVKTYLNYYGKHNCIVIMLDVDDFERERRARRRGSFDKTEWDRRVRDDAVKFSRVMTEGIVDITIDNTRSIDTVYAQIRDIIAKMIDAGRYDFVSFYGTDSNLMKSDSITADSVRNLIAKIPALDISLRRDYNLDAMSAESIITRAVANSPLIKTSMCKELLKSDDMFPYIFEIIAFGMREIDGISMRVIPHKEGSALVTDARIPWSCTDEDTSTDPKKLEKIMNRWFSFVSDEIKPSYRYFTKQLKF